MHNSHIPYTRFDTSFTEKKFLWHAMTEYSTLGYFAQPISVIIKPTKLSLLTLSLSSGEQKGPLKYSNARRRNQWPFVLAVDMR